MNFLWILLFIIGIFAFLTFVRKWHDYSMLIMVAIGCAVSANYYNGFWYPLPLGNNDVILDISSVLIVVFIFTVLFAAHNHSVQRAKVLTSSTVAAIIISAVIEFVAKVAARGWDIEILKMVSTYIISALSIFILVWSILYIYEKISAKKINIYLTFTILSFIGVVIYSVIYYGLYFAIYNSSIVDLIGPILLGHLICFSISIVFGLFSYFLTSHYWKPKHFDESKLGNNN